MGALFLTAAQGVSMNYALQRITLLCLLFGSSGQATIHPPRRETPVHAPYFHPSLPHIPMSSITRSKNVPQWTLGVCMERINSLSDWAIYNLNDMLTVGSNADVNVVVQIDDPNRVGTWIYYITKNQLVLDSFTPKPKGKTPKQSLIDFGKHLISKYPSQYLCIVAWDHGSGDVEPRSLGRGIFFEDSTNASLSNPQLGLALASIKTARGKPLDVFGIDACLEQSIAMNAEVGKSALFNTMSIDVEPGQGYPYSTIISGIQQQKPTPKALAQLIVNNYGAFFLAIDQSATQSATDTSLTQKMIQNINDLSVLLKSAFAVDPNRTFSLVVDARLAATTREMYTPAYIDLKTFLTSLIAARSLPFNSPANNALQQGTPKTNPRILANVHKPGKPMLVKPINSIHSAPHLPNQAKVSARPSINTLLDQIAAKATAGLALLDQYVVANQFSSDYSNVGGLTIYFPTDYIDKTVLNETFMKTTSTQWLYVLRTICGLPTY